jgi:hypothetical protein
MSRDARNSLIAWGVVLVAFVPFWAQAHYHLFPDLPRPPPWLGWIYDALLLALIGWRLTRGIRTRRRERAGG